MKKFLAKALGEIVLIVIGILVALAINDWDDSRKRKSLERKYLQEIKFCLKQDLARLNSLMQNENERTESMGNSLLHLKFKRPYQDSLDRYFSNFVKYRDYFSANTSGFENLKSEGFDLVVNDKVREGLISLYSNDYRTLERISNAHSEAMIQRIEPLFAERFIIWHHLETAKPVNYSQLTNDEELISTLGIFMNSYESPLLNALITAKQNAWQAVELINLYLNIKPSVKNVKFRYSKPIENAEVFLSGSFNEWNQSSSPMKKAPEGWLISIGLMSDETYEYKFIIKRGKDVIWTTDPLNPDSVAVHVSQAGGMAIYNSVIRIE